VTAAQAKTCGDDTIRATTAMRDAASRMLLWCVVASCCAAGAVAAADRKKPAPKAVAGPTYAGRADVHAFAVAMAGETGMPVLEIERWIAAARFQPKIVAAMDRPVLEPPKWFEYAPQFLASDRVAAGVAFWREHAATLDRAEASFGVPPEIVVAIIGVESFYGRYTGSYRVIDALATLAFDYPRRANFFRGELTEFLLLAREQRMSPLAVKGSFAGAIGMPQFMPGSYRRYAVDFDGDGRIDLAGDAADVIGSVAHYLARHDWQPGAPVLLPARIAPESLDTVLRRLDGGISERRALSAWEADGVAPQDAPADAATDPLGVLLLEERGNGDGKDASYWIAYPNFYVITRYNKSRLYAAAVTFLAQALRASHALSN
jgi:membrane-bound lytic murein transglycosylase B